MARYLYLHAATTGQWQFKLEPDDPAQPHLVRMALLHVTDGVAAEDTQAQVDLIWPDPGWHFEPGAVGFHGITRDTASENGRPIRPVMDDYAAKLADSDALVLFAAPFWMKVLRRAFLDAEISWVEPARVIDAHVEIKRLVHANAPKTFGDCYRYCTGHELRIPSDPIKAGEQNVRALAAIFDGIRARS